MLAAVDAAHNGRPRRWRSADHGPRPVVRAMSVGVDVEVLGVDLDQAGTWWYRVRRRAVARPQSPVAVARLVAGISGNQDNIILHSTSWRHTDDGVVVLTFLACPDPQATTVGQALPNLTIAQATGCACPAPADLQARHVVAHAIRHLAFLVATDPSVSHGLLAYPLLLDALALAQPAMAGALTAASPVLRCL